MMEVLDSQALFVHCWHHDTGLLQQNPQNTVDCKTLYYFQVANSAKKCRKNNIC